MLTTTISTQNEKSCICNLNGGKCENNQCKCNIDFYGEFCDYTKCKNDSIQFNQCVNGFCVQNINKTTDYKCECNPGYGNALCEIPICKDYCYNNGQCNDGLGVFIPENNTYTNSVVNLKCTCSNDDRFSGDRCEFDKCHNQVMAKTCPTNCTLDSSCKCLCGKECDDFYCNGNSGTCVENNGHLSCK